jgi:hypothetical protein
VTEQASLFGFGAQKRTAGTVGPPTRGPAPRPRTLSSEPAGPAGGRAVDERGHPHHVRAPWGF